MMFLGHAVGEYVVAMYAAAKILDERCVQRLVMPVRVDDGDEERRVPKNGGICLYRVA